MTDRLYYSDSYLREFDARVLDVREQAGATVIVLDQTAFYPTSGGQPHDLGTLGGAAVTDVIDEQGTILHVTERPVRGRVHGVIDWPRRFDHMQQHTGQHVLSQAFLRGAGAGTKSVHFGADVCTLDLDITDLSSADAAKVEDVASQIVFEDRPIVVTEVDESVLPDLGLRRPAKKRGQVRIVNVQEFDVSACGGTHVARTGEIGPILIRRWERLRGGVRVEFFCGWRAVRDARWKNATVLELAADLSVKDRELADAVRRVREQLKSAGQELTVYRARALEDEARRLLHGAAGSPKYVTEILTDRSVNDVALLAGKIVGMEPSVAALATADGKIVVARAAGIDLDAGQLLRTAIAPLGGRGGGRSEFAQGAVPAERVADAIAALRQALADA
ncbi:MAG TPA: DHHA1 domain-containing protein [bacterium]|jgi:alanyl-tRNA synthetase|nr:DHHA1 domain-containing protein [bacterium]